MFSSPGAPIRGARTACAHPSTHPSTHPSAPRAARQEGAQNFSLSSPIPFPSPRAQGWERCPSRRPHAEQSIPRRRREEKGRGTDPRPNRSSPPAWPGMMDVSVRMRASPRYGTAKPMRAGGHCALRAPPLLEMWVPSLKLRLPHSCRSAMQNISPPPLPTFTAPQPSSGSVRAKKNPQLMGRE